MQVEPSHYYGLDYDTKDRFCTYWYQIYELVSLEPTNVLEIGLGNGFLCNYLRRRGSSVTTLDIDARLKPDGIGSVVRIPFADSSFDAVACYEVLEHLPFDHFAPALSEIHRVARSYAVLSLPDSSRVCRLYVQIPKMGRLQKLILLPQIRSPVHHFDGQHYWEINKAGYALERVVAKMEKARFEILKTYRVFEKPRYRFFVLRKER